MNAPQVPFYVGLFSVVALFIASLILGVFVRAVFLAFKKHPVEKFEDSKKRKRKRSTPSATRTIEIDPDGIDRIYVKKVS